MRERIVIADDNQISRNRFFDVLQNQNYLPIKAQRLDDLIDFLKTNSPELILFNNSLVRNGVDKLISDLHKNHKDTSILFLLTKEEYYRVIELIKEETDDYLIKPIDEMAFLMKIDHVLKYRQTKKRNKLICHDLLEANRKLSNKSKECQRLINFNKNIFESVNVGLFTINQNYNITSWNKKIGEILGISQEYTMGKSLFSIFPYLRDECFTNKINEVIQKGKKIQLGHVRGHNSNNEEFFGDFKISPIIEAEKMLGAVVIVEDITYNIYKQEESDKTRHYLSNLVEHSADAIISYTLDGIIVTWNIGACNIFGYSREDAVRKKWDFNILDTNKKQMNNLFEWVKKTGSMTNFEAQMINKDGHIVILVLTLSLIKDSKGNTFGLSGIFKDLSENKKLKQELINSQRMVSLGLMSAGMANDINNPLSTISDYLKLLQTKTKRIDHTELTNYLIKVEEDADQIRSKVQNALWYAKTSKQRDWVDMHELINRTIDLIKYQRVISDQIIFKKDFINEDVKVNANAREIVQVFLNMLSNAIDAMPDGGVISIKTKLLEKEDIITDSKWLCIYIIDEGVGIPKENLNRIFDQFFTTRSEVNGNGLGLYVVRSIIENHGGKIEVSSQLNKGSCFTIYLPIKVENNISLPDIS